MIPTCAKTRELFAPLTKSISSNVRFDLSLNSKGDKFILDIYKIDELGYKCSAGPAAYEFINRLPERRARAAKDGSGKFEIYELGVTDCTVELFNQLIPKDNIFFEDEETELTYNIVLRKSKLADGVSRLIAAYKEEKLLPQHEYELCADAPLVRYQQLALIAQQSSEGFGLFMEQGTGKTPIGIAAICNAAARKRKEQIEKGEKPSPYTAIIVCPNSVRQNWFAEFQHFATRGGRITILRGTQIDRVKLLIEAMSPDENGEIEFSVVICGYQTLWRSWESMKIIPWDLAILDESQAIKDIRARQTQTCLELRDRAKQRIVMTGTPIANSALDLYTQLEFLGKGESGFSTWEAFRKFYGVFDTSSGWNVLVGVQNLPFMQERLSRKSFFISKNEAMPDLPEKVYDICEIEMTADQEQAYKELATNLAFEIENDLANDGRSRAMVVTCILTKLLRLAQITSGFVSWGEVTDENGDVIQPASYEYFADNPKIEATIELLKEMPDNEKTIIWACWIPDIEYLKAACEQHGISYVSFDGSTSEADRQEAIRRFNHDRDCKVFIGTAASGGAGLNLLGYPPGNGDDYDTDCTHIIYFSQNWSQIHRSQSEDRAHRRGTRRNVRITDLCVPGTIDEEIRVRVLSKKKHAIEVGDLRNILQAITGKK